MSRLHRPEISVARLRAWATGWDVGVVIVCAAAAVFAAYFIWLCLLRYEAFATARFDLGNMVQAVWSTAHGHFLETTDSPGRQISRLGIHVDPILALFAPLWWIWSTPKLLLVAQTLIVASGALPVYWIGRRWLRDWRVAAACAGAYLLYPPLQWAVIFDFHPVTLATPLLMWCIWAIEEDRPVWLAVFASLSLITKEEVGLAIAGLGLWVLLRHRRTRMAALLIAGGLVWTVLCVAVITPHFASGGASPFIARYGELGTSPGAIARSIVMHPVHTVQLLVSAGRRTYLLQLLAPVLFLALVSPLLVLCAVPELLINMLTKDPAQYSIYYQYTSVITPFVIAGMIAGLARIRQAQGVIGRVARMPVVCVVLLLGAGLVSGYRLGPLPFWKHIPGGSSRQVIQFTVTPHDRAMARAVALVPVGVPVSVSNQLGGRLSDRRRVLNWPIIDDAQWVLVDTKQAWLIDKRVKPRVQAPFVTKLERNRAFVMVFDEDGVLVFARRSSRP